MRGRYEPGGLSVIQRRAAGIDQVAHRLDGQPLGELDLRVVHHEGGSEAVAVQAGLVGIDRAGRHGAVAWQRLPEGQQVVEDQADADLPAGRASPLYTGINMRNGRTRCGSVRKSASRSPSDSYTSANSPCSR